jgi:cytochrome c oxidase assembly factor CtaG
MSAQDFLRIGCNWDRTALALAAAVLVAYGVGYGLPSGRKLACLLSAIGLILLVLISPIGTLAQDYLFTAHMLQHLVLLLVAPPLFLLSLPQSRRAPSGSPSKPAQVARAVPLAWLAGVGAMWLWHAPTLCNAAGTSPTVRHFQTLSLLVMGTLFWWPLLGPRRDHRLQPLAGMVYLFSACSACTLLGIYITFTPLSVCSVYNHPVDRLGILPLIRHDWQLTPELDQHIGGLMMWVPACLIYLSGIISQLARWYASDEDVVPAMTPTGQAHPALPEPGATKP